MKRSRLHLAPLSALLLLFARIAGGQQAAETPEPGPIAPAAPDPAVVSTLDPVTSSTEQGQTRMHESFEWQGRDWRIERRQKAIEDTQFKFNFRTMYLNRGKYDGSRNEAWAAGGWAGAKTGYFADRLSVGATGYTSQHLAGDDDTDGTLMLAAGQEGYSVLGEAYGDLKITEDINLYFGRKEYDTPYINRNDTRMTPNTFEAITLHGRFELGGEDEQIKYGVGYFNKIKERNSDEFVFMSKDAGAAVERGVLSAGALYEKGDFSIGAIDYFSQDIINIAYGEAKWKLPLWADWKPSIAAQFSDQRSTGSNLLSGEEFEARQFGVKADLPVGSALFTTGFTHAGGDANMQSPWSGYPGYTSVQVEDFNRDGESAVLFRAAYEFNRLPGVSAYALWVNGSTPDDPGQYRKDETNVNLQWAPPEGVLKGLSVRLRYAVVEQHGGGAENLDDFRVILNYGLSF